MEILIAEDDDDDFILMMDAVNQANVSVNFTRVNDGEELLDYLLRRGRFEKRDKVHDLIIIDKNMPKMDGFEALAAIKSIAGVREVPVIILSNSNAKEDIRHAYNLGAASYIQKALSYKQFANNIKELLSYWFETVLLPIKV